MTHIVRLLLTLTLTLLDKIIIDLFNVIIYDDSGVESNLQVGEANLINTKTLYVKKLKIFHSIA